MKNSCVEDLNSLAIVLKSYTLYHDGRDEITSNLAYCLEWCVQLQPKSHFTSSSNPSAMNRWPDKAYAHCHHSASLMSNELGEFLTTKGVAASKTTKYYKSEENGQAGRYNSIIWRTMIMRLLRFFLSLTDVLTNVQY